MSETRRQRRLREFADHLEKTFGPNIGSKQLRANNRRVEERKREQFRRNKGE